eukprot:TRINITY_DN14649_c0_g1_i3.p1 TRINITY_DN14649_c0_g1~~TRINITY_DN14649_c0_g1_i3.p1  ORF type:complete len:113 (+),score=22.72 TRINITY_DN14649_c0_g1_i3:153-491(+)
MKSFANPEHFFKASYKKSQIKTPLINSMNNSSREKQLEVKELKFEASSNRQIKSNISFTTSKSAATIGLEAKSQDKNSGAIKELSLIHISEPTRPLYISYAVFCLKKKKKKT